MKADLEREEKISASSQKQDQRDEAADHSARSQRSIVGRKDGWWVRKWVFRRELLFDINWPTGQIPGRKKSPEIIHRGILRAPRMYAESGQFTSWTAAATSTFSGDVNE